MKTISRALKIAIQALGLNKGRSILTILGIVIGIALVIVVMSAGNAIRIFITDQVESFGSDTVNVEIHVPGTENPLGVTVTTLKKKDADAIKDLDNIKTNYAGVLSQAVVSREGETKKAMLFGITSTFLEVDDSKLEIGEFFTEQEEASMARVVILGAEIKDKFFEDSDPIGGFIRINNANYKVIGVFEEKGVSGFFDFDTIVYMPLKTLQKVVDGIDHVSFIVSSMHDPSLGEETKKEMEALMRDRHQIDDPEKDDFIVYTMEEARDIIDQVIGAIQILLIALASISLVVGGVGIMNIMYVSVNERTYEIGLRKAIGAKNKDILYQFLIEAIILTLIGGFIGIILGAILSYGIAVFANAQGFAWSFHISPQSIILGVGFSVVVGIIFGLYPAKKASKLNPIEALRYE